MKLKEQREKAAELAAEIRKMADLLGDEKRESKEFTAEEETRWKAVNTDYDALKNQIDIAERADKVAAEQSRDNGADPRLRGIPQGDPDREGRDGDGGESPEDGEATEEHRCEAIQAWFRHAVHQMPLLERHTEACRRVGLNPNQTFLDLSLPGTRYTRSVQSHFRTAHPSISLQRAMEAPIERRDLGAVTGSGAGYTIPTEFVRNLEINMLAFGGMLQVGEILNTATGADLDWPTADDTSNTGEQLGEAGSIGSSVDPTVALKTWKAYKFSSKLIKVSAELLEDSAFDMVSIVSAMLGERLGRISNTKFTTGTGVGTPKGLTVASTLGVTSASATAIIGDEIFDLIHSVDPAYRNGAGFMLHDNIILYLRKLKDGNGQYIWTSGLRGGVPDTLANYPITVNQDMQSSVATATITIEFGQLSRYKIRRVRGIRFYRLVERYRDNDQEGFVAFLRQDGNLLDSGTAPVKHLLQA